MSQNMERVAEALAPAVAAELSAASEVGCSEANFRKKAARILEDAAKRAGLDLSSRDEYSVASGRVDSLYNKLVIEYKAPGKLKDTNEGRTNQEIVAQTQGYVLDVARKQKKEAHRLAGVVTDGRYIIFIRRFGESWAVDEPEVVNATSTERLLRMLFTLSKGAALIPENLIENFGPETLRAWRAVGALYQALHRHTSRDKGNPLVVKLFEQWRIFFGEATDYKEWSARIESKKEFRRFVAGMKLDPKYVEAPKVFFALHTYYALLIKLVASLAAARFAGGAATVPFAEFAGKEGDALKKAFIELERGGLFRQYGIRNFLEGDFFGWYATAWDVQIEEAVTKIIHGKDGLAEYDPGTLELAPENARDLLKNLYHSLLPKEIRHDLGEYYTPDWLAEHVIRQTLGDTDLGDATKRVLDPACGSGTFLVLLIKFVKDRAAKKRQPPERTLELILQNIVGFDLNPLAVIAARTNYLLALGDLLRHRKCDIDIPVYQCDSILTPSRGSTLFDGDVYPMETSVGEFRVPAILAARERLDAIANELDQAVEDGVSAEAFLVRVAKNPAACRNAEEMNATKEELLGLYTKLKELHDNGLNGVWARIIKNAFAPLFIEPCHYIVGNPPWVNWENLPDRYRDQTKQLWRDYSLFPRVDQGFKAILGGAKYDLSMLFTYVSADRYLRENGRLGFVLSQALFKTAGSGAGFRRFSLPQSIPLCIRHVDDMVALRPFQGATNRTSTAVITKGTPTEYPLEYDVWTPSSGGRESRIPFDADYGTVHAGVTIREEYAEPVDPADRNSAWITLPRRARAALAKLRGQSDYIARKGVYASINGVFWLHIQGRRPGHGLIAKNAPEQSKIKVQSLQTSVEEALVFPLVRGRDVARWSVAAEMGILVTHKKGMRLKAISESEMQAGYPRAWSYLVRFKDKLLKTGLYRRFCKEGDPFYSMFDIGDYTFSQHKCLIREIAGGLTCAVCGTIGRKPVIPDHKLVAVATNTDEEAHYLCAVLNSLFARAFVEAYCLNTQFSTHIFRMMRMPRFSARDKTHRRLAQLSHEAHEAVRSAPDRVGEIEAQIDRCAAQLWDLSAADLAKVAEAKGAQRR